jgi:hypothetical protein
MKLFNNQEEMQYGIDNYHNWVHVTCRRAGKTVGAANVVKNQLYKPNSIVQVVERHSFTNCGVFHYLTQMIPSNLIEQIEFMPRQIILKNNSLVYFVNGKRKPTSYRDYFSKISLAVFDEMMDDSYDTWLRDMLRINTKCLVTGTPTGSKTLDELTNKGLDPFNSKWGAKRYSYAELELVK